MPNFDFFGVYSSNRGKTQIYGFPEGYWPGGKTASEDDSMLYISLQKHRSSLFENNNVRNLSLHAENCSGQNKNKYMMFYFSWRVIMGYDD